MGNRVQKHRLLVLALLLQACFAGLCYRLVELQWIQRDALQVLAAENTHRKFLKKPLRGDISDSRGNLLATSQRVKNVCADPPLLAGFQTEVARVIAPCLRTNETDLIGLLQPRIYTATNGTLVTNHYVVLRRKLPEEDWEKLDLALASAYSNAVDRTLQKSGRRKLTDREALLLRNIWRRAIFSEDDQLRVYPARQFAAHVVGFTGEMERQVAGREVLELTGVEGLEATLDKKLKGIYGWRWTELDSKRRELVSFRGQDVEPRPGLNVVLTLDLRIQQIIEEEIAEAMRKHSPISVSALAVRPRTGEILGLANLPTFDPNQLTKTTDDMRRNRVITDTAEPGSTFKIVVVAGALNEGQVTLRDVFDCEHGRFWFAGRWLRDHESYGLMSVEEIITKSSNIGTAKIAIKMGQDLVYRYIRDFGFGSLTEVPFYGESAGIVHPPRAWTKISISRIPIGQGVAATPIQMVMAMAAVANEGVLMRPMIVDRLEDEHGQVVTAYRPQMTRRVLSESAARQMVTALKTVATEDGTARKAILEHYTVAGKTGTAEKPPYHLRDRYYASFIGFFPADNPEICIGVMLDEPNVKTGFYGGQVAAPVFKRIGERVAAYLKIKPDVLPEPPGEAAGGTQVNAAPVLDPLRRKL